MFFFSNGTLRPKLITIQRMTQKVKFSELEAHSFLAAVCHIMCPTYCNRELSWSPSNPWGGDHTTVASILCSVQMW